MAIQIHNFPLFGIFTFILLRDFSLVWGSTRTRPNIVFILTDDQDLNLGSLEAMPKLASHIQANGVTFSNSFVAAPLCCPSRSSILTGKYVHNHHTFNNSINGGCSSLEWQAGSEKAAFPVLLQNAGYRTFFAGKYLNQYGMDAVGGLSHVPPGWSSWVGLKGNSVYYDYYLSVNGSAIYHGDDTQKDYLTNVIRQEGTSFIHSLTDDTPFFMLLSTPACHDPFTPEPKYRYSEMRARIPETPDFNIQNSLDKHWLLRLGEQPLREEVVEKIEEMYRNRLRTLRSVDDMIEDVVKALRLKHLLDNTFIFFTSDNGYHLGQFSLSKDKRQPYEFDIKVPLMVRGPGITRGSAVDIITTNVDLAPTFLDLAEIRIPETMDGLSLKQVMLRGKMDASFGRSILIEHSGEGVDDVQPGCEYLGTGLAYCQSDLDCKCQDSSNNTYSCVRRKSENINDIFCKFKDSEHFEEYFDISNDPYELNNAVLHLDPELHHHLKYSLDTLTSCSGKSCLIILP